jgi:hypothetical protein
MDWLCISKIEINKEGCGNLLKKAILKTEHEEDIQ